MPKTKVTHEGQPCRTCGTPVEIQVRTVLPNRNKGERYYFDYWLRCPGCFAIYHMERARRTYTHADGYEVEGMA